MLAVPKLATSLAVLRQLRQSAYMGPVAAIARYPDEIQKLEAGGASLVFNMHIEAGTGFAQHVSESMPVRG